MLSKLSGFYVYVLASNNRLSSNFTSNASLKFLLGICRLDSIIHTCFIFPKVPTKSQGCNKDKNNTCNYLKFINIRL